MRDYDDCNRADDRRNSKMSDLAQDNAIMRKALREISEVYIGSEGFNSDTPREHYLKKLIRDTYLIAIKSLKATQ